jgi:hypothetical protein
MLSCYAEAEIHAPSHQLLLKEIGIRDRNPNVVQKKLTAKLRLTLIVGIRIYKTCERQHESTVTALHAYNAARHDPSQRFTKNG